MARFVLLDTGVLGLSYSSPTRANTQTCLVWIKQLEAAGTLILIPDIVRYEASRELIRMGQRGQPQLRRLAAMLSRLETAPVTPEAWDKAAEFWAIVRQAGKPTAHPQALDADAILAGVAATIAGPGDSATIATTNVRHLSSFPGVDAQYWNLIV